MQIPQFEQFLIKSTPDNFFSTLAGCDGGNINAKVWVIGLEWYGNLDLFQKWNYRYETIKLNNEEILVPYRDQDCFSTGDTKEDNILLKNPFDNLLANFAIGLTQQKDDVVDENFIKNTLYGKDSPIFKLNLFPLPRKKFDASIDEYRGTFSHKLPKEIYKKKCIDYRFPLFRNLIKKYKPDVIICLGLGKETRKYHSTAVGIKSPFGESSDPIKFKENDYAAKLKGYFCSELSFGDKKIPVYNLPFLTSRFGMGWNMDVAKNFATWGNELRWALK
ncbi:hypothetical protein EHQ24_01640 [Leptospira noumeaensis]|uniref:Uncharacterized protein n=1 Tax=Leptospira noumeaensis TaxID=2484964 RepID=A0A4R9IHJ2_9LEPT|nr:hypothetical protein [Leptospira noumeaensis]TGK87574.1 hypothetical protein EHQ24_01640 [Leptospira noumeaensis]